mmetsp:Transcript_32090/g.72022  ORF Transcript_32090/g.72022 Transcript_32090/m.72022 type:complete len:200 (-) Transcript_32090:205-804(-)
MSHIRPFHSQSCGSDKSFVLRSLPGKIVPNESALGHHPFPCLVSFTACSHDLKHFVVGYRLDFRDRNFPLPCLLFPLLFHRIAQNLRSTNTFTVQQVGWHRTISHSLVIRVLIRPFIMLCNSLAHRCLFLESFLVVQFCSYTMDLLRELRTLVCHPSLAFALTLLGIEPASVQLSVPLHMLMLRHGCVGSSRIVQVTFQ